MITMDQKCLIIYTKLDLFNKVEEIANYTLPHTNLIGQLIVYQNKHFKHTVA
jgi:hypothetical protein